MNNNEAKKDCAARLKAHGCIWSRMSVKSVSFQDLMRADSTRVTIIDCITPPNFNIDTCFMGVPKSTKGGYLPVFKLDKVRDGSALQGTHFNKYSLDPVNT